jgi:hypothetical protein
MEETKAKAGAGTIITTKSLKQKRHQTQALLWSIN